MKTLFRRTFATFLIVIFLLPQVEKAVHDFEHRNDFHCNAADTHFHQTEHHCSICDFAIPLLTDFQWPQFTLENNVIFHKQLYTNLAVVYVSFPDYFFSLRAPPTVS